MAAPEEELGSKERKAPAGDPSVSPPAPESSAPAGGKGSPRPRPEEGEGSALRSALARTSPKTQPKGGSVSSSQALSPRASSRDRDPDPGRSYTRTSARPRDDYRAASSGYGGARTTIPVEEVPSRKKSGTSASGLSFLFAVALIAFFGGFVTRNLITDQGGFDDERIINAARVPSIFSSFCYDYNGYPSFTVVEMTSVSSLTMATVPILHLDTCTIPVNQTANALQALGIERRANTIGPQLGGSNLTLLEIPLGSALASSLYAKFPGLANGSNSPQQTLQDIQQTIDDTLTSNMNSLKLQNLLKTNIKDVYVMVPGHSFNLNTQLSNAP